MLADLGTSALRLPLVSSAGGFDMGVWRVTCGIIDALPA